MGCDIHIYAERFTLSGWVLVNCDCIGDLESRSYGTFGFLAGVRNYSDVPCIAEPRGLPDDVSLEVEKDYDDWRDDAHSASWLGIGELATFDYDAIMEDRRVTKQTGPRSFNGGCTCEPGGGKSMSYRDFLGDGFVKAVQSMQAAGVERIVFWFDN